MHGKGMVYVTAHMVFAWNVCMSVWGIVMCTRLNQYEVDLWPWTLGSTSTSVRNAWKQLLDKVRATRHEVRVLREQQKMDTLLTISSELEKMQEKTLQCKGVTFR